MERKQLFLMDETVNPGHGFLY